ncbi:MAG: NUDIX hydrolase [Bacteroidota bacterium]|nr:NUDIX hydrolase [Bacteroidota bacterium]
MSFTYKYPRPAVTVDCLIFSKINSDNYILLIQRKNNPYKNYWAFPGGFVDNNEDIEKAAHRELNEETGLEDIKLKQFYTFGKVNRDPRGRTITIAYFGFADKNLTNITANSDAKNAKWIKITELPKLAFDHNEILNLASKLIDI